MRNFAVISNSELFPKFLSYPFLSCIYRRRDGALRKYLSLSDFTTTCAPRERLDPCWPYSITRWWSNIFDSCRARRPFTCVVSPLSAVNESSYSGKRKPAGAQRVSACGAVISGTIHSAACRRGQDERAPHSATRSYR